MNRAERIGMNEAVFRDVNERIQEVADQFQLTAEPLDLICECGDASCVQRVSLTRAEYEALREDPNQFAIFPGHDAPDVETVVGKHAAYEVVRKKEGIPAQIAHETDPRSNP